MATKNKQLKYFKLLKTFIKHYINHKMWRKFWCTLKLTNSGT